jgi:NADH dehydrogenase
LAVESGRSREDRIVEAIGPETFTFRGLVEAIAEEIGVRRLVLPVPPWFGYLVVSLLGRFMGDVMLTRQEIKGLMADLLYVSALHAGSTKLTDWMKENADSLGLHYASELARHRDRQQPYEGL